MALLPVSEALARILATARLASMETITLSEALGRFTATDIKAKHNQPPFQASAMDGYAVVHDDIAILPVSLNLIGVSAAGHGFKGVVKRGQAVRILTGAPLPKGADTVVTQENVTAVGKQINVNDATAMGRNIRAAGLDFAKGVVLVKAGTKLGARDIGLLASGGHAMIRVRIKPRVAIIATGDELALPGTTRRADQITSSNSFALAAFAKACGAEVIDRGIIKDDLRAITSAIKRASSADVLITTGGASVGDHDFVQEALRRAGVKIDFWKIAMRPGKPFMFGSKGKLRVLGLPGNPVAAMVCVQLFLKPLIESMLGVAPSTTPTMARLGADIPANDQRQDYLRAILSVGEDGARVATPAPKQDSSMQRVMQTANCLIVRDAFALPAKTGVLVPILLFPDGV
ncbi:MAG: molybdopterin molybdotransferase MoeA [Pseudomonadota bacterium]|nr:molybdopterin molybdotransferase MoeA [Pseudomonadota bacterium]